MRLAIVAERQNGVDSLSDVERAHSILKAVAIVEAMEFPADFQPTSPMIGNVFGSTGIELDRVSPSDATRIAVGMGDMVEDAELARTISQSLKPVPDLLNSGIGRHLGEVEEGLGPAFQAVSGMRQDGKAVSVAMAASIGQGLV